MNDSDRRLLREALKAQNRQPVSKKHNGLGALCLPLNERPAYLERVGLEVYFFLTPRIMKVGNDNKKGGLYLPPGMVNEILVIDGVPGVRVLLKPKVETPVEVLSLLFQGYKARHLL